MANNYCYTSSLLEIPREKISDTNWNDALQNIMSEAIHKYEEEDGHEFYTYYSLTEDGILFQSENADIDGILYISRYIIEKLEIDIPFYCSYAYTCDRMRLNEFGGGSFLVVRGENTEYTDSCNLYSIYLTEKAEYHKNKQNEVIGF